MSLWWSPNPFVVCRPGPTCWFVFRFCWPLCTPFTSWLPWNAPLLGPTNHPPSSLFLPVPCCSDLLKGNSLLGVGFVEDNPWFFLKTREPISFLRYPTPRYLLYSLFPLFKVGVFGVVFVFVDSRPLSCVFVYIARIVAVSQPCAPVLPPPPSHWTVSWFCLLVQWSGCFPHSLSCPEFFCHDSRCQRFP